MSRRIRIIVAYDGTAYKGWQIQAGLPSVQQTLEDLIGLIEGKPVAVAGSGRTDAGVHAHGQVAAFTLDNPMPVDNLRKALNSKLPEDIRVMEVREMPPDFHPRFDAIAKTYEYRIWRKEICPPVVRRFVHHHPYPLNEAAIHAAAPLLEGEHDFTAFAASNDKDHDVKSKVRNIYSSRSHTDPSDGSLIYRVRGSGFLKHMVRNIVGVLLQVGRGNVTEDHLLARLQPNCGIPAGPTAPARGLFLVSVEYPIGVCDHQLEIPECKQL